MKKIIFAISLLLPFSSFAKDGVYVGVNINRSEAKHRLAEIAPANTDFNVADYNGNVKTSGKNYGFGFEAGYKKSFGQVFVAPELFFDQLNNRVEDPSADLGDNSNFRQDGAALNYRYGAKLNLGYNVNEKFAFFVNAGLANVDYDVYFNSQVNDFPQYTSYGASKLAMIYGFGASYDILENLAVKFSYDKQNFGIRYMFNGWRSSVKLQSYKVGLGYVF